MLTLVVITAFIGAIAAAAALTMSLNRTHVAHVFDEDRLRAKAAAEAGLVWAMQRLWADPNYCGNADPPDPINGLTVNVTVIPCAPGASRRITATANYL